MTTPEFPRRTAGDLTLPNGDLVWICTLNTLLREQADNRARRYAQNECRGLLKGGADYAAVVAEIRSFPADKQAQYLAQQEFFSIREDSKGRFPSPPEPTQGDLTPEAYAKQCQKWDTACKAAEAKRKAHEDSRYEAEIKRATALSDKVRVERCVTAYFAREFSRHFVERMVIETMLRAVRIVDDHSVRYFASMQAVEDAPDDVLQAVTQFYNELDTVRPDQVPT